MKYVWVKYSSRVNVNHHFFITLCLFCDRIRSAVTVTGGSSRDFYKLLNLLCTF